MPVKGALNAGTTASSPPGKASAGATKCAQLLEAAVNVLGGTDGAVFAVSGEGTFERLVSTPDLPARGTAGPLEQPSELALRAGGPCQGAVPGMSGLQESYFAMPLELDNDVVGVLVVTGIGPPEPSVLSCTKRLGSLVDAIALAVDRLQTLAALGRREEEVIALYRQLNAFALDFRSTYAAERARAKQLAESVARLARTYHATVRALAMVAETKDERTAGHLQRVSRYGMLVTDLVAPEHGRDAQFEYGFLLHDVGKLTLPDGIFTKEGPLTDAEWELVREHPSAGRSILEDIDFLGGACEIVYSHHERWDGTGYPRRLRGTEIPLGARIFAVCDAFEAMTSDRPYRPAVAMARALGALRANAGGQFWPDAVEAFLSLPAVAVEAVMAGTGGSWP